MALGVQALPVDELVSCRADRMTEKPGNTWLSTIRIPAMSIATYSAAEM
jgi:hypothetical protein